MKVDEMKRLLVSLYLGSVIAGCTGSPEKTALIMYADPFVGTAYVGHTFPGAAYPFGFMQPGPQTGNFGWDYCAGYNYEDTEIWGFSQNRLNGTGIPDLGDILVMPFCGDGVKPHYRSGFSKGNEKAHPGYYSVRLDDNDVEVELTCSEHVAMHRYRFGSGGAGIFVDLQSASVSSEDQYHTRVLNSHTDFHGNNRITGHLHVTGWVERDLFYAIEFSKPYFPVEECEGDPRNKAPRLVFGFGDEREVSLKVAFSTVSVEGALRNIEREVPHWDFNRVRGAAERCWEEYFSRIVIEGSEDARRNLYTSLYHLLIQPNNIADTDGLYRGPDGEVHTAPDGRYYSTFSLWDTFRGAHSLYTVIYPEMVPGFINSMLLHSEVYGYLPIWALWGMENYCMIGNHGVPPVVEAVLKGIPGIDAREAYRQVRKSLTTPHYRSEWDIYDRYGYSPFDLIREESVSRTLECCYDDWCAALLARHLGYEEDYRFFMRRAGYYRNLFDDQTGFMRGRDSDGNWRTPFDVFHLSHGGTVGGDYTEGNAWQYTWHVLHQPEELIGMLGGEERFCEKLDSLFTIDVRVDQDGFTGDVTGLIGQYAHGNEPSHHVVYLYGLAGRPDRTAELVREVFDRFYLPAPDGLCGNDDCGQMSAWYIFSALGFYPVDPASGMYVLGAPQVEKATVTLSGGKKLVVEAEGLSQANKYVAQVSFDGRPVDGPRIAHTEIAGGGTLKFVMTDKK